MPKCFRKNSTISSWSLPKDFSKGPIIPVFEAHPNHKVAAQQMIADLEPWFP